MDRTPELVNRTSSSQAKIALFRPLFRGLEDVYPRRFESRKMGKAGYAPACANEWVSGICEKPRINVLNVPIAGSFPVTDDVIRWHLSGRGPQGEPSWLVSIRCPSMKPASSWLSTSTRPAGDDAIAFLDACCRRNLPAALERSRSGRGVHVWSSSRSPFRPRWPVGWRPTSSPRRRRDDRTSACVRMIACFRIRTRCRKGIREPDCVAAAEGTTTPAGQQRVSQ